jgi:hypothetical protein
MRVIHSKCGGLMFFDVELQTCQLRNKVHNCAKWERKYFEFFSYTV